MSAPALLPRARLRDVANGRAALVGSRLDPGALRGFVSPVEAQLAMGIAYRDVLAEEREALARRSPRGVAAALLKAALAAALSPGDRPDVDEAYVVAARLRNLRIPDALDALLAPAPRGRARLAYLVHPHALNLAVLDAAHRARLAAADLVLPDGVGIRIAAGILGFAMRDNLCGTDLVPALQARMIERDLPLVMIGGRPGVADACAARWREARPALRVPIRSHGYLDAHGIEALRRRIRRLGPAVVLVGMGSPRQEAFAAEHLAGLPGVTVLTVGGLFDYFADRVPRAPLAWRELGLEWLYRVLQEPRRLLPRYLVGNPFFLGAALWQRLRRGPAAAPLSLHARHRRGRPPRAPFVGVDPDRRRAVAAGQGALPGHLHGNRALVRRQGGESEAARA